MRIKIIGENNCARATRHLLRLGGFAVTEFLPSDAVAGGPLAGYAITIDVAPGIATDDLAPATDSPDACLRPELPPQDRNASGHEEAGPRFGDVSSPSFFAAAKESEAAGAEKMSASAAVANLRRGVAAIHFDSVESDLEAAVLRHVAQLSAAPVIVDRPGGVVRSDRELRIVLPNSGDAAADESAAVAVEFGILRGLLDLVGSARAGSRTDGKSGGHDGRRPGGLRFSSAGDVSAIDASAEEASDRGARGFWSALSGSKWWWPFGMILMFSVALGFFKGHADAARSAGVLGNARPLPAWHAESAAKLERASLSGWAPVFFAIAPRGPAARAAMVSPAEPAVPVASAAQGQFATGQEFRISDGTNFLIVDPCKGQAKLFASINQTANAQLVSGTASKKIYICSVHVVAAAATNVAVVEGTGSVCATGTAGVSGFGGATAATGWNFSANGGIALGNGDSSLGAEGTAGDNLCIWNSGSGQVSGGISYVVQ